MKPFYDHAGITIFHGDCREVLPQLPPADVVLTDPPWTLQRELMEGNLRAEDLWAEVAPLLKANRLVLWLPIHFDPRPWLNPLADWPYLRAVYIRRAIPGYYGRALLDGEMVHVLGKWPSARKGRMVVPGGLGITYRKNDRVPGHPGPRSLIATRWLVKWWSDPGDTILDPFAGSGTTLVAAKELGRKAIGVEIEEAHCELTARRLAQEVFPFAEVL